MRNKVFISLSIFLLILCTLSVAFAEDTADTNCLNEANLDDAIVINESTDVSVDLNDNSLNSADANDNSVNAKDLKDDSQSKDKLSSSQLSDSDYEISMPNMTVKEGPDVALSIKSNYSEEVWYGIDVYDSDDALIFSNIEYVPSGDYVNTLNLGALSPDTYSCFFEDEFGTQAISYIKVNPKFIDAKITVSNYTSYYKSGKKLTIKSINKANNKPVSVKLKLVYKKANSQAKTYYATTNSKGVANVNIPVGVGTYSLTVTSASSDVKANKASVTVKVNPIDAKITVPNYSSYYKSGKKLTIKSINKANNKPVSVKLKLVYKKGKKTVKTSYVTTNSKGVANVGIPVGIGTYSLTVSATNSTVKANKPSSTIKVNKYVAFKAGKYSGRLTYNQVLSLKKAKANGEDLWITVKTGKYYTYKTPIYKTVKVKKSKWVYKYKLASEDWWGDWGSEWESYNPKTPKGYTWCGTTYKSGDGWSKTYYKYKKKVYYWTTKKVKTGKYKKAKDPIYMTVSTNSGKGQYGKCDLAEVWSSKYWDDHEDSILTKEIKF